MPTMAPRTTSLQSNATSQGSYFDYDPETHQVSPVKTKKPSIHCLDAFHQRPGTPFEYPLNANLYANRALPAIPPLSQMPALRASSSSESLSSAHTSRPSTSMSNNNCCDKSLPPLPLFTRTPSFESVASSKCETNQADPRRTRPRSGRSISFRGLLHRHTYPSTEIACDEILASSIDSMAARDSRADSVLGDLSLTHVKTNQTTTSSVSVTKRPSALSLGQLRATSKKGNANVPPMPTRPALGARKASSSISSTHRWNPFGRNSDEDKEDIPPMPATPSYLQELSFTQCYYFFARNCNGYVLSNGANGDACENCAALGFLGSP